MDGHRRVVNREQQDAQELFQLIASRLDQEHTTHARRAPKDGMALLADGMPVVSRIRPAVSHPTLLDTPLTGLLASRLSCMECNYTVSRFIPDVCALNSFFLILLGGHPSFFLQQYSAQSPQHCKSSVLRDEIFVCL